MKNILNGKKSGGIYQENVCLKINAKLGGLRVLSLLRPFIFFFRLFLFLFFSFSLHGVFGSFPSLVCGAGANNGVKREQVVMDPRIPTMVMGTTTAFSIAHLLVCFGRGSL